MKIITISGLDGSGKSTQIKLLKDYLKSHNKRVFYFHAIQHGLAKKISKIFHPKKNKKTRSITEANFFQIILRRIFLMIDIWQFKLLRNKLRNKKYDYILSDRYFYDSMVNIYYLGKSKRAIPCEKFIQRPTVAFYLKADPKIIMRRERKPEQGLQYLEDKKKIYDKVAKRLSLKVISGDRSKDSIFKEMRSYL